MFPMATDFEEILTGPFEAWIAPLGTAFPDIDEAITTPWELFGSNGALNYDEVGVTIAHEQTMESTYTYGTTGQVAAHRTQESHRIGFTLIDLSAESLALILRGVPNDVTDTAPGVGTAGVRTVTLLRGLAVAKFRLLLRGVSAYDPDLASQYEGFKVFQSASQNTTLAKGAPGRWPVEFTMLFSRPDGDDVGRLVIQDAIAS